MLVVAVYAAALWVPGLLVGRLAGVRSWTLVAAAPLLTYAVAGVGGPALHALGVGWSPATAAGTLLAVAAAAGAFRWVWKHRADGRPVRPSQPGWPPYVHRWVAVAAAGIVVLGAGIVWTGIGRLSAVPQDWDAAFHANGIRWIADTGDAGLTGMGRVNWYETGVQVFYPNAYHLLGAVVFRLTGTDVPTVLNAHTVLLPGMGALAVIALVHRFRGRATLAVAAAAFTLSVSAFYDMLWRGPLLPFAAGAVLVPVAVVLLFDALDAPDLASRVAACLVFAGSLAGLICLNPAMLFSAVLLAAPAVVQRWVAWPRMLRRDMLTVAAAGVLAAALVTPQLLGSLQTAAGEPFDWPAEFPPLQATVRLLTLSPTGAPQWALVVLAAVGVVRIHALRGLRWIGVSALLIGVLFVLSASSDEPWVTLLTRPWWNDRYRLAGLFVVPVAVLAGHGVAEVQRLVRHLAGAHGAGRRAPAVAAATVAVMVLASTELLYVGRSVERMRRSVQDGPVVSRLEVDAMRELAAIVPPGDRVLNDRLDGSVWMYAIAGVQPVAGHYGDANVGPDAQLLSERFNTYPEDWSVQAAVRRLRVSTVIVNRGFVRPYYGRAAGLTGLSGLPWLEPVYVNPDATIYRIRPCARWACAERGAVARTSG